VDEEEVELAPELLAPINLDQGGPVRLMDTQDNVLAVRMSGEEAKVF